MYKLCYSKRLKIQLKHQFYLFESRVLKNLFNQMNKSQYFCINCFRLVEQIV